VRWLKPLAQFAFGNERAREKEGLFQIAGDGVDPQDLAATLRLTGPEAGPASGSIESDVDDRSSPPPQSITSLSH
jgi:hypothetical protein